MPALLGQGEGGAELIALHGGRSTEVRSWDARFELRLADAIDRLLANDPPPTSSAIAADASRWGTNLRCHGQLRLAALDDEGAA